MSASTRTTKITVKKLFFFDFLKLSDDLGKINFFSSVSFDLGVKIAALRLIGLRGGGVFLVHPVAYSI